MATTVAAAGLEHLRIRFEDVYGDTATLSLPVATGIADGQIATMVDDLVALSDAKVVKAEYGGRVVSGYTQANSGTNWGSVAIGLELDFEGTDPINAAKTISRTIVIPAPKTSLRTAGDLGLPDLTVAALASFISQMETNLAIVDSSGAVDVGGLSNVGANNHFITVNHVLG